MTSLERKKYLNHLMTLHGLDPINTAKFLEKSRCSVYGWVNPSKNNRAPSISELKLLSIWPEKIELGVDIVS